MSHSKRNARWMMGIVLVAGLIGALSACSDDDTEPAQVTGTEPVDAADGTGSAAPPFEADGRRVALPEFASQAMANSTEDETPFDTTAHLSIEHSTGDMATCITRAGDDSAMLLECGG